MRLLVAFCLVLMPALAFAQAQGVHATAGAVEPDLEGSTAWHEACMKVKDIRLPPSPPNGPPTAESCKANGDYYAKLDQAMTTDAEWAIVRACAIAANDDAVLSMLYANGLGVKRDTTLATHYMCNAGGSVVELSARVKRLAALPASKRYDQCDDVTRSATGAVCADIAARRAGSIRSVYFKRLRAALSPPQLLAFDRLVKASDAFASAHAEQETARGGTAYASFVMDAQAREQEWLREHLFNFEKGSFNAPPASRFAADDAELNRVYQLRTHPAEPPDDFDVSPEQIRATQRLWLAYRDAWVAFAALRYPQLPADSLKALLTQWRIKQISRI
jgi:hypothetical protein